MSRIYNGGSTELQSTQICIAIRTTVFVKLHIGVDCIVLRMKSCHPLRLMFRYKMTPGICQLPNSNSIKPIVLHRVHGSPCFILARVSSYATRANKCHDREAPFLRNSIMCGINSHIILTPRALSKLYDNQI